MGLPSKPNKRTVAAQAGRPRPPPSSPATPVRDRLQKKVAARFAAKTQPVPSGRATPPPQSRTGTVSATKLASASPASRALPMPFHSGAPVKLALPRAVPRSAAQFSTKGSGVASALGSGLATELGRFGKHEKKKGKGKGFMNFLKGAARVAAGIIPELLPVLLASNGHAPSIAAAQMAGFSAHGMGAQSSMVGLATPASVMPLCGLCDMKGITRGGKLIGCRFSGMEYIGSFDGSLGYTAGDVVAQMDMNPMSETFLGTRLQSFAGLYERFKFRKFTLIYEPSCASTTEGALGMYIDTDPDDVINPALETPTRIIQNASGHLGYEQNQAWTVGVSAYCPDKSTQDYYLDADGSDDRLISPGTMDVLAITDIDATATGTFYAAYDVEMVLPQVDDGVGLNGAIFAAFASNGAGTGSDALNVFGWADDAPTADVSGVLSTYAALEYDPVSTATWVTGLPVGVYAVECIVQGNADTTPSGFAFTNSLAGLGLTYEPWPMPGGNSGPVDSYYTETGLGVCAVFGVLTINTRGTGGSRFGIGCFGFQFTGGGWSNPSASEIALRIIRLADAPTDSLLGNKRKTLQQLESDLEAENNRLSGELQTQRDLSIRMVKELQALGLFKDFDPVDLDKGKDKEDPGFDAGGKAALMARISKREASRAAAAAATAGTPASSALSSSATALKK